ncbi:MAG: hypothetical protein Terrestrivirus1_356 [Terrestrivirus sp.]|uniref:Uncharacterized protein n=1 Tax=Terrestrivirus sp. TaxID=2487775 RepID=A0A3G4ZKW3_9VIRU|nr:MAG: hypothetical protein Terrestrivirus1_356 [Terrestrivirus sp.]
MSYYLKQYKLYKQLYLDLKYNNFHNQSGGVDKSNILFHGTSTFYFDFIKQHGMNGRFPNEDIVDQIKIWYPKIINYTVPIYVDSFLARQTDKNVTISFTPNITIAKEFSEGARQGGEGINFFTKGLHAYLNDNMYLTEEEARKGTDLYFYLNELKLYPGFILAIKSNNYYDTDLYEIEMHEPFGVSDLYIYDQNTNNLIPLNSNEADSYVNSLIDKSDIENKKKKNRENHDIFLNKIIKNINDKSIWKCENNSRNTFFASKCSRQNDYIVIQYDTGSDPYMYLSVIVNGIESTSITIENNGIIKKKNDKLNSDIYNKVVETINLIMSHAKNHTFSKIINSINR